MDVKYVAKYLISLENLNDVKFGRITLCWRQNYSGGFSMF